MAEDGMPTEAYWGGKWHKGAEGTTFKVFDPSNGQLIAQVSDCNVQDATKAVEAASEAFKTWSKTTVKERASLLHKIKEELLKNKEQMAKILTKENGKPYNEALGEVGFASSFFEWFAEEARRQYGDVIPSSTSNKRLLTIRQPSGVAALITPWNFPIGMIGRKVSAALAAGCTCVVKPAEDTPLVALLFAKICHDVGVPKGVVNVVTCSRENVQSIGQYFSESEAINVLSFTGSVAVGKLLYSLSGKSMKKMGLELGGNAPFIVFESADLRAALDGAMAAKFRNTGQTCVTANRFYLHESIHDRFVSGFAEEMDKSLKVGSGFEAGVNQGPIINDVQFKRLNRIVDESVKMGAKVVRGAKPLKGLFYAPTLLTEVTPEMPVAKEEIFGPVAAIMKFKSEAEVVELANHTDRGLAGFFYTNDVAQSWRVSESLEYGMVGVNEGLVSTCEAPFGGIKTSGLGKEGSKHGLDEYSHIKYICFGNI